MAARARVSPQFVRLLQLAATLLATLYMLFIGGTFDATVRFRVQLLNVVAAGALGLAWLAARSIRRQSWRPSRLELPLLLFAASQWVALLTSAQPRLGLEWAASLVAWTAAFCIVYDLLAAGWPREFVINTLLLVAAVLAADGVWAAGTWYAGWLKLGMWPPITFRFDGLLGHANLTAAVLNLLLPLVIMRAAASKAGGRLAVSVLAAAMLATEFFTSSRAGWLACAFALLTLGLLLIYRRGGLGWLRRARANWMAQRRWVKSASLLGPPAVFAGAAWLLARQAQHITHGSLVDSRLMFWTVAWDLFKHQPLTGSGPDLYAWFYSGYTSIPPEFFAPHAHSLIFQILSGSGLVGLLGLAAVAGSLIWLLWRGWSAAGLPVEMAALMAGLTSVAIHNSFDYLFGTPVFPFLVILVAALALAPQPGAAPRAQRNALWLAPALLLPLSVYVFALRGSYWNDAGITAAAGDHWPAATVAFEQAGAMDPRLALYWEEAAYAQTRSGATSAAVADYHLAQNLDPFWAIVPAAEGALRASSTLAADARALAPESYLFALNAGAIAETQGDASAEREAYTAALNLNPTIAAALYWEQNAMRTNIRNAWQATQPPADSAITAGWAALANHAPGQAVQAFLAAKAANPDTLAPYLGLVTADIALGNFKAAQQALDEGQALPVIHLDETLGLHLASGDLDEAQGNRAGAIAEYSLVFSAVSDFNIDGPGSFADTNREWQVFHREALPGELIPQLPRAQITADMDQRFARLAQWYLDEGKTGAACLILGRVQQEAPISTSAALYPQTCPGASS